MKKRKTLCMLAAAVCLMLAAGAAAEEIGVRNYYADGQLMGASPAVLPEAERLILHDAGAYSFAHTDVTMKEVCWDGRVLRIVYSVRDRTADSVYTDDEVWACTDDGDFALQMSGADADGITAQWGCDFLFVNGESVCLTGSMASRAGKETGEVLVYLESDRIERMAAEGTKTTLGDAFEVWLPILYDYRTRVDETPQALHCTVRNRDLPGLRSPALPEAANDASGGVMTRLTQCLITPMRTYVQGEITLPAGLDDAAIERQVSRGLSLSLTVDGTEYEMLEGASGVVNAPGQRFEEDEAGNFVMRYHMAAEEGAHIVFSGVFAPAPAGARAMTIRLDETEFFFENP